MLPYVIHCNDISNHHLSVFRVVTTLIHRVPDKPPRGLGLTAGEVCDCLLAQEPYLRDNLKKVTGVFGNGGPAPGCGVRHDWLEFSSGKRVIIDAYPRDVASGPILIYARNSGAWYWLYTPDEEKE